MSPDRLQEWVRDNRKLIGRLAPVLLTATFACQVDTPAQTGDNNFPDKVSAKLNVDGLPSEQAFAQLVTPTPIATETPTTLATPTIEPTPPAELASQAGGGPVPEAVVDVSQPEVPTLRPCLPGDLRADKMQKKEFFVRQGATVELRYTPDADSEVVVAVGQGTRLKNVCGPKPVKDENGKNLYPRLVEDEDGSGKAGWITVGQAKVQDNPPSLTPAPPAPTRGPAPIRAPTPIPVEEEQAAPSPEIFALVERERADRVFQLINDARQKNGLDPLSHDERLYRASLKYVMFLHDSAWLDYPDAKLDEVLGKPIPNPHTRRGNPTTRASEEGYRGRVSEVLGYSSTLNPRALEPPYGEQTWKIIIANTVNGWLASPGHREAILSPTFRDTGVGCITESNYRRPASNKPVITFLCVAMLGTP